MAAHHTHHSHGHRFDPARMHVLEDEDRRRVQPAEPMLDALALRPGERVLDVGCGTGYLARPAARRVAPTGEVVGADVDERMLEEARRRAAEEGVANLSFVRSEEDGIPVRDASFDVALLVSVLHELDGPSTLHAIARALRPGGRFAVVDWDPAHEGIGPPRHHRLPADEARRRVEAAGFTLDRTFDAGPANYGLLFRPAPLPARAED